MQTRVCTNGSLKRVSKVLVLVPFSGARVVESGGPSSSFPRPSSLPAKRAGLFSAPESETSPVNVKRVAVGLVAAGVLAGLGQCAPSAGWAGGKYTSTVARLSPDNRVMDAVRAGSAAVGIETVRAVGFSSNCSGLGGRIVVCRDKALDKTGRARVLVTSTGCVIALDPRLGGGTRGVRVIGSAFRGCVR